LTDSIFALEEAYLDLIRPEATSTTFQTHQRIVSKFTTWYSQMDRSGVELRSKDVRIFLHMYAEIEESEREGAYGNLSNFLVFAHSQSSEGILTHIPPEYELWQPTKVWTNLLNVVAADRSFHMGTRSLALLELLVDTNSTLSDLQMANVSDVPRNFRSVSVAVPSRLLISDYIDKIELPIAETTRKAVEEYLKHRDSVESNPEPLFATAQGRASIPTLQKDIAEITRPCRLGIGCPGGYSQDDCEAAQGREGASNCDYTLGAPLLSSGLYNSVDLT